MKAIFAGAFDPFTMGHRDVAERALKVFGTVVIAVAAQTGKNAAPLDVRKKTVELSVADMLGKGVTVTAFDGALSDFVKAQGGACVLVRGVRNGGDWEYENAHARIYNSLCGVESVFFAASPSHAHISSTAVRELAYAGCALDGYAAENAIEQIKYYYGKRSERK